MSTVYLVASERSALVDFGLQELRTAFAENGHEAIGPHASLRGDRDQTPAVVVRRITSASPESLFEAGADGRPDPQYPDESFLIERRGGQIVVESTHPRGLMYGCLELADLVRSGEWEAADLSRRLSPALAVRGVKLNLPWEPYSDGDPFRANVDTCWDLEFWRDLIDELARGRYNCLSLWSLHPFHLMVSSPEFRAANPFSDQVVAEHEAFFHALFGHALDRGIEIYLFTWNIYLPEPVALGLGLPGALANGSEGTETINRWDAARARQGAPQVRDYYEEMIYRLLATYPEISGIGTSGSEAMSGSGAEKEKWVVDTYLRGIERSRRRVRFIHRTNMQSTADIIELAAPHVDPERFYISWKYSIAHCYSHPRPAFEDLWGAWEGVDLTRTQVLYTVRNDDIHTHRWADADYVREYVRAIRDRGYVHGFYWGADGYLWGRDFQHVEHGHKDWRWDFERHRLQFRLWGRISFDPDVDPAVFAQTMDADHGPDGAALLDGLTHASRLIPAINRLLWRDLDFQWHPEGCLTRDGGLRTVLEFVESHPMPGSGTVGIREFAHAEHEGRGVDGETPLDIIELLRSEAAVAEQRAAEVDARQDPWRMPLAACATLDLHALAALGRYYAAKIEAALDLARAEVSGAAEPGRRAVASLEDAVGHWEALGYFWGQHYQPYRMARVDRLFGYTYYLDDVRRDVRIARERLDLIGAAR